MNFIYRLVFNRALRVLQVASELVRSSDGGTPARGARAMRRHPLAMACLMALGMAVMAVPAHSAEVCPTGDVVLGSMVGVAGSVGASGRDNGGDGGDGGAGSAIPAGRICVPAANTVQGGNGGAGGDGFRIGGNGGAGGIGIDGTGGVTLTNIGTVAGGDGGDGGNGNEHNGGAGGMGGAGVGGEDFVLVNTGTIRGGDGGVGGTGGQNGRNGDAGSGGSGVVGTGGATVVNAGTISGGLSGDGTPADAVHFSGGGNTLTLEIGATVVGHIVSTSGTVNGGDTFILGDNAASGGSDSLDIGTVSGFADYEKTGTGTWTLTGTGSGQNWLLQAGTLRAGNDGALAPGDYVIDGGTLDLNGHDLVMSSLSGNGGGIVLGRSGGSSTENVTLTVDQAVDTTYAGTITGPGYLYSGGWYTLAKEGAGTLTLTGASKLNSFYAAYGGLDVNDGTLVIAAGGSLRGDGARIGFGNAPATLRVSGSGTFWSSTSLVEIGGAGGEGLLRIEDEAQVEDRTAVVGRGEDAHGRVEVDNAVWNNSGGLTVGAVGQGELAVTAGGTVNSGQSVIGQQVTATGAATIAGQGTRWDISGNLIVGDYGRGTLDIENGGYVRQDGTNAVIGLSMGAEGHIAVAGTGSMWSGTRLFGIGEAGHGTLDITGGGQVDSDMAHLGQTGDGRGEAMVSGEGSTWTVNDTLTIGVNGQGRVTLTDGGRLAVGYGNVVLAENAGSTGTLAIGAGDRAGTLASSLQPYPPYYFPPPPGVVFGAGDGTLLFNHAGTDDIFESPLTSSQPGAGTLRHEAGITLLTADSAGFSGDVAVEGGTLRVEGTLGSDVHEVMDGSVVIDGGTLRVDRGMLGTFTLNAENGALIVENGGAADSLDGYVGLRPGSDGSALVTGAATWTSGLVSLGHEGRGVLTIEGGGSVVAPKTYLGFHATGDGVLHLDGTPDARGLLETGFIEKGEGSAALTFDGGILRATADATDFLRNFAAGDANLAAGGAFIDSNGHTIAISAPLQGEGGLTKQGEGTLVLVGDNSYAGGTFIEAGTLRVGNGGTSGSMAGDVVNGGNLIFERSDDVNFSGAMSGSGLLVQQGSGTLVLDGDSHAFAGTTTVQTGRLLVGGTAGNGAALGGDVAVNSGATLGGHGRIGGDVTLDGGAHLAPGASIGTLTIDGDLAVAQGGVLDFEFGAPDADFATFGSGDSVRVGGDLSLDGAILDVSDAGGMGPGLYNLFTWGGTLTANNGGIVLGDIPAERQLQIRILADDRQINLFDTTGIALNVWNANGKASPDRMGGGDGIWSVAAEVWTDVNGVVPNQTMQPQPGFALFGGDAGVVTVEGGDVTATGMQFAVDGYRLTGDPLTLVKNADGEAPVIRVGDGTDAAMTATIDGNLAGSDGFTKTDRGTLVLGGANAGLDGIVTVNGGTLEIAAGATPGAGQVLVGGKGTTLQVDAGAALSNAIVLDGGAVLDNAGGLANTVGGVDAVTIVNRASGRITGESAGVVWSRDGSLVNDGGRIEATGTGNGGTGGTSIAVLGVSGAVINRHGGSIESRTHGVIFFGTGEVTNKGDGSLIRVGDDGIAAVILGGGGTIVNGAGATIETSRVEAGSCAAGAVGTCSIFVPDADGTAGVGGALTLSNAGRIIGNVRMDATAANVTTLTAGGTIAGDLDMGVNPDSTLTLNGDRAAPQKYSDAVTGTTTFAGTLTKSGGGTWVVDNDALSDVAGTTIAAGTLQIGDGGTTGAITGNVVNAGALVFDRSDAIIFDGAVSGTGSLVQQGGGMLTLTGTHTYTGGTTIASGTLQVGDGRTTGSLIGHVANDGTLVFDRSDDVTFDGVISGTGSLVQQGSGALTLTGAHTYGGGTTVAAGTLIGDTASLQGAIANQAALVFAQAGNGTFDGTLSGTGTLRKTGTGELVLNGDNAAFTGNTIVRAGALIVGDDGHADAVLASAVTVAEGALLGGFGTVGGIDLSGTLATGHSIGTLHVTGDVTFQPGSTWRIDVSPDGHGDRLDVAGRIAIQGGSALALGPAGDWKPQTDYVILNAGGGIDGEFDDVGTNLAFLEPSLTYAARSVTLSLVRNQVDFGDVARTPNQIGVATGTQGLGWGAPVYDTIVTMDAGQARDAFDQLSGEWYASMQTARLNDSRYVREAMDQRLTRTASGLDTRAAHLGDSAGTVWFHGWGQWGEHDGDGNAARMKANGSGLLVGVDAAVGEHARIGGVLGASQASIRVDERVSDGHGKATWLGFYGSAATGPVHWRAGMAYARERLDSNRHLTVPGLAGSVGADLDGRTEQGWVEVVLPHASAHGRVAPFLNLAHVRVHTDDWREGGSAAALQGTDSTARASLATLGVRGAWDLGSASRPVRLHGSLGWRRAFGNDTPEARLSLAGSERFTVYGLPLAGHAVAVQAGLDFAVSDHVSFDVGYSGQFASDARAQGGRMTLTVDF